LKRNFAIRYAFMESIHDSLTLSLKLSPSFLEINIMWEWKLWQHAWGWYHILCGLNVLTL